MKSDFGLARSVSGGTLTPRRYQGCFVLHTIEKVTYGMPADRFGESDWHGLLDGYRQSSGDRPLQPES